MPIRSRSAQSCDRAAHPIGCDSPQYPIGCPSEGKSFQQNPLRGTCWKSFQIVEPVYALLKSISVFSRGRPFRSGSARFRGLLQGITFIFPRNSSMWHSLLAKARQVNVLLIFVTQMCNCKKRFFWAWSSPLSVFIVVFLVQMFVRLIQSP